MAQEICGREARAWTHMDAEKVAVGDLVSAEAGGLPIYSVLRVENGRLWMREARSGAGPHRAHERHALETGRLTSASALR